MSSPEIDVGECPRLRLAKPVILAAPGLLEMFPDLFQTFSHDCELLWASTGTQILKSCISDHPDVVLLTDKLQDLDSLEVVRHLKKSRLTAEIGVIYITSGPNPKAEVLAFAAGIDDCIAVPLNPQVLKARVHRQIELKAKCEALQSFAATDSLTGLANRRRFDEAFELEWKRAARDQVPLSLLMVDVDHFKAFNDLYGHPAGDECLKVIGEILKPFGRRPGDLVARYGGEEFVIILPGAAESYATGMAKNMLANIRNCHIPHSGNLDGHGFVTASAGLATILPHQTLTSQETLLYEADQMLYEAKRMGRDRVMSRSLLLASQGETIRADEPLRIAAVKLFKAARGEESPAYAGKIGQLAVALMETSDGFISLTGRDYKIFAGSLCLQAACTPRDLSFCAGTFNAGIPLIVPDAPTNPGFKTNPLFGAGPGIRPYAGAPLTSTAKDIEMEGLSVIDRIARRPLPPGQSAQLTNLAKLAIAYIDRFTAPPGWNVLPKGIFYRKGLA